MSNVISINRKKDTNPLRINHNTGKITHKFKAEPEDFGDRINRIRTSLEKINTLMAKLKKEAGRKNYESV